MEEFRGTSEQVHADTLKMLDARGNRSMATASRANDELMDTEDKENDDSMPNPRVQDSAPARGRGSRGSKVPTAHRSRAAAAPKLDVTVNLEQ